MDFGIIEFTLLVMFLAFLALIIYREYQLKTN
jgi:hypothetical protein